MCPSSHSNGPLLALLGVGLLTLVNCGIEGEDIDFAGSAASTGSGESGDGVNTNGGDGDGDGTTADADTSGTGGDGDGDPTTGGDGDGDGDGSTSGDGDGSSGDGDGDPTPCEMLMPGIVVEGPNDIMIAQGVSVFEGSCGATGPEALYAFTATGNLSYHFELTGAEPGTVVYLVEGTCIPLSELDCSADPLDRAMAPGEVVYLFVDSVDGVAGAVLTITGA